MQVRKILFWLHLAAGCIAGAIILLMSVTGVLLTYERQIVTWSAQGHLRADPPPGAQRLPVQNIVDAARRQRPDLPGSSVVTLRSDPREPAEIRIGREAVLYVDTYTGTVTDGSSAGTRSFFQKMMAWHRWLGVEGEGRATARAITGACNLAFLLLIVTGAYLWWPRSWSWQSVRPTLVFRSRLSGKARDFNWHNVFGVWALVPLFFVVLTALPMSYPWANDLLYRITGSEPPPPPGEAKGAPKGERKAPTNPVASAPARESAGDTDINALWARAANQAPDWKSISANAALPAGQPAVFTIDTGSGRQPQKRSTLTLDPATGALVRFATFADENAGRRLRMWSRFVHTGEYYGVAGQTVAGLASVAGVMLVWTGISLALRRLGAWNTRRRRSSALQQPEAVSVSVEQ